VVGGLADPSPAPRHIFVADRTCAVKAYAMTNLQERGVLFVEPTTEVYEGMIVG
jgi:predicted membrane GTPase involved in stress response